MKGKNSDLPSSMIWMVFGVVISACIIIYFTNFYHSTVDTTDRILAKSSKTLENFDEYEATMYEYEEVRGSLVINFIKKNLGGYAVAETAPFFVRVSTRALGISYTNDYENKDHIKDIKNVAAVEYYINPNACFECEIIRNENKVIQGIQFIQK